jgi:uncharacterized membrane protein
MAIDQRDVTLSDGRSARHAAAGRAGVGAAAWVAVLGLIALLVALDRVWAAQLLLVPLLLIVPGALLLQALRVPGEAVSAFPVYVPAASLVVMLVSGLAVDLVGPLVGVAQPLRTGPLLLGFEIACLGLLAAGANAGSEGVTAWNLWSRFPRCCWPLVVPILAAIGALRLNNGNSASIAVASLLLCLLLILFGVLRAPALDEMLVAIALYAIGLAVMWSFSLRGDLVYGFDISSEYYDLHLAVTSGIWHVNGAGEIGGAYGAMLSLTVLPAQMHFLTGISALMVFKALYPAIFGFFPLAVYWAARRVLSRRWAFAAGAFIATQSGFMQQIVAVARQEVALILFAALFIALFDTLIDRRARWELVGLLSAAVVVTHYSTTYEAITILGLFIPLQFIASWLRPTPRITGTAVVAFAVLLTGAVLWYGPLTHTDSNLVGVADTTGSQGLDLLPSVAGGGSLVTNYLQGTTEEPINATQYSRLVHIYYVKNRPWVIPLPDAGLAKYDLNNSAAPDLPTRWPLISSLFGVGQFFCQQFATLLGVFASLILLFRRRATLLERQIGIFGVVASVLLAVIRLSGTIAAAYGGERAFLQVLLALAVSLCWAMERLAGRRKWLSSATLCVALLSLIAIFAANSGVANVLLGGEVDTNLSNTGDDAERYDVTVGDLAAASWLGKAVMPGQIVYADRYGQLELSAVTGLVNGVLTDVTPLTLNQHAWIFASTTNVREHRARALYGSESIATYVFPNLFINQNYDLVYDNGSAEVFDR